MPIREDGFVYTAHYKTLRTALRRGRGTVFTELTLSGQAVILPSEPLSTNGQADLKMCRKCKDRDSQSSSEKE